MHLHVHACAWVHVLAVSCELQAVASCLPPCALWSGGVHPHLGGLVHSACTSGGPPACKRHGQSVPGGCLGEHLGCVACLVPVLVCMPVRFISLGVACFVLLCWHGMQAQAILAAQVCSQQHKAWLGRLGKALGSWPQCHTLHLKRAQAPVPVPLPCLATINHKRRKGKTEKRKKALALCTLMVQ